jgi:hypothetical protein
MIKPGRLFNCSVQTKNKKNADEYRTDLRRKRLNKRNKHIGSIRSIIVTFENDVDKGKSCGSFLFYLEAFAAGPQTPPNKKNNKRLTYV